MSRTICTPTNKLNVGDTVQFGNMIHGFYYATIAGIEPVANKPRSRKVSIQFNHGGIGTLSYGINSQWFVLKAEAVSA